MSTLTEQIRRLEGISVMTSKGSFVPMDEVKKLLQEKEDAKAQEAQKGPEVRPRSLQHGRVLAMQDEELKKQFPKPSLGLGAALPASQTPPPPVLEGR